MFDRLGARATNPALRRQRCPSAGGGDGVCKDARFAGAAEGQEIAVHDAWSMSEAVADGSRHRRRRRAGLTPAGRAALDGAEIIIGAQRHLMLLQPLLGASDGRCQWWPVPFADGITKLMTWRGRKVVMLASGDPFWFGAGSVILQHLEPGEWRALPGNSVFSLVAGWLGWPLQSTICLGFGLRP